MLQRCRRVKYKNMPEQKELDPSNELMAGEKREQLPASEDLEKLEAPSPDMFLGDGKNDSTTQKEVEKTREDIKNSPEKKEQKEEIRDVSEFLEVLESRIAESEGSEKVSLSFHLRKIKEALRQAKLKPKEIKLMSSTNKEDINYKRNEREIRIREDILDDVLKDKRLFATIFSEGQIEKTRDIRDLGFQLLAIEKRMPINREIGKIEKQAAERAFSNLGLNQALKLYDFKNPEKLADSFLEKDLEKRMQKRGKINKMESIAVAIYLSQVFKKGAPKLYKKLQDRKYAWRAKVGELVQEK